MHIKNARNLAHDFSVKLSPCMCSYVRLTWLDTYIYLWWLYLYMYAFIWFGLTVTNPAVCHDKVAYSGSPHDDESHYCSYIKVKVLWNFDDGSIHISNHVSIYSWWAEGISARDRDALGVCCMLCVSHSKKELIDCIVVLFCSQRWSVPALWIVEQQWMMSSLHQNTWDCSWWVYK